MASSSSQLIMASSSATQPWDDLTRYLPLHRAILGGNLASVKGLCGSDKHALEARITVNLDTALHVAVGRGMGNHIVEYLLNKMSRDQVALQNSDGNTALSVAAILAISEQRIC
ncbi:hypothetical protein Pint_12061 [Pistacia integerrima]|uniref:Uncharacterized protein n=1 Tax=Pistacia integerrima TaxID=434235 RepID=A0ACC0XHM0_9ROSI|nr:hypothetical protein Pint_12061 [Pistacia integerrima]